MKNILIILTLFLFSCNESVIISKEEYNKLKGDIVKSEYPKVFIVNEKEYLKNLGNDGHEYYKIHTHYYDNYIPYPDCKKCKRDRL